MTERTRATRASARVALVTCADLPALDPDDRRLVAPLRELGVEAVPAVWDDPRVDWAGFDLVVLRSTWDYTDRVGEFLAWARRVPRLANPAPVVGWNTDKRYLVDLDLAGVPVVPTRWVGPDDRWEPPDAGEWVVKPAVGAGSRDCGRYQFGDPAHRRLGTGHVDRLRRRGRTVMLQPYLPGVDSYGETALLFLPDPGGGGLAFSHAVRKGPMLAGPDYGTAGLYRPERISGRVPSAAELALARRVVAAVPADPPALLYARVDLIPGPGGRPVVVELELTEPSLFLRFDPAAAPRLAAGIAARAGSHLR